METEVERIARLEAIVSELPEMKSDIKQILEYQNRQKGQATILGLLLTALIGLGGWFSGSHFGR